MWMMLLVLASSIPTFAQDSGKMDAPGFSEDAPGLEAPSQDVSQITGVPLTNTPGRGWTVTADIDDALTQQLDQAVQVLSRGQDLAAANFVLAALVDSRVGATRWQAFFHDHVGPARFTSALVEYWDYAVRSAGDATGRVATLSAFCAADAAGAAVAVWRGALRGGEMGQSADSAGVVQAMTLDDDTLYSAPDLPANEAYAAGMQAAAWLLRVHETVPLDAREGILSAFREGLNGKFPPILPVHGVAPVTQFQSAQFGMQIALALAPYSGSSPAARTAVSQLLGLPQAAADFWEARGSFLLDNGGLSAEHLEVLNGILASIPPNLVNIPAYLLPSSPQPYAAPLGLAAAGPIVQLSAVPLNETAPQTEFMTFLDRAVADKPQVSLFGARVAQELVRAIQRDQFERRPELRARREHILANAKAVRERYLRQSVDPAVYVKDPDEFLPALGLLWFGNTPRAFRMALDIAHADVPEPMESLLLMADLLAGPDGTSVPLFEMDAQGKLTRTSAPVTRATVAQLPSAEGNAPPPSPGLVISLQMPNGLYRFEYNPAGGLVRVHEPE